MVEMFVESPVGRLRLVASADALVGVFFAGHVPAPRLVAQGVTAHPILDEAARQLEQYFAAARQTFALPLAPRGTDFQRAVWRALATIPFGARTSYGELARALPRPTAARALGHANARNPLSIVLPCHRVVGRAGSLVGYAGGLERKAWLLAHEARIAG